MVLPNLLGNELGINGGGRLCRAPRNPNVVQAPLPQPCNILTYQGENVIIVALDASQADREYQRPEE